MWGGARGGEGGGGGGWGQSKLNSAQAEKLQGDWERKPKRSTSGGKIPRNKMQKKIIWKCVYFMPTDQTGDSNKT